MKKVSQPGIIYALFIGLFIALIIYITITQGSQLSSLATDPVRFKAYLNSYGAWSVAVFLGLQVFQVVVAAIPGEVMQLAGGYVFGMLGGAFYSVLGILLGTMAAFFIARLLGYPFLKIFVSEKTFRKYELMLNSPRAEIVIFILFLIPGLPKDLLSYLAGVTPVKPVKFIASSTVARFPGILISSYIGANLQKQNMTEVIIASVIAIIIFLLGVLYREQVLTWASRFSSRRGERGN